MCSDYPADTSVKVLSGARESARRSWGWGWGHSEKLGGHSGAPTAFMGSPLPASPQRQAYEDERPHARGKANAPDLSATQPLSGKVTVRGLPQSWAPASSSLLCSCRPGVGGGAERERPRPLLSREAGCRAE